MTTYRRRENLASQPRSGREKARRGSDDAVVGAWLSLLGRCLQVRAGRGNGFDDGLSYDARML
jgi:hypothetical protein